MVRLELSLHQILSKAARLSAVILSTATTELITRARATIPRLQAMVAMDLMQHSASTAAATAAGVDGTGISMVVLTRSVHLDDYPGLSIDALLSLDFSAKKV